jgi:hypothetical protein
VHSGEVLVCSQVTARTHAYVNVGNIARGSSGAAPIGLLPGHACTVPVCSVTVHVHLRLASLCSSARSIPRANVASPRLFLFCHSYSAFPAIHRSADIQDTLASYHRIESNRISCEAQYSGSAQINPPSLEKRERRQTLRRARRTSTELRSRDEPISFEATDYEDLFLRCIAEKNSASCELIECSI